MKRLFVTVLSRKKKRRDLTKACKTIKLYLRTSEEVSHGMSFFRSESA